MLLSEDREWEEASRREDLKRILEILEEIQATDLRGLTESSRVEIALELFRKARVAKQNEVMARQLTELLPSAMVEGTLKLEERQEENRRDKWK